MEDSWVSCYVPGWIVVPFTDVPDSIIQPPMECTRPWREENGRKRDEGDFFYLDRAAAVVTSLSGWVIFM